MDTLALLKANLGLTSTTRDVYLQSILESIADELASKGVQLGTPTADMFAVDYAAWRYRNRGESTMPRNLQYRLHNLQVAQMGGGERG